MSGSRESRWLVASLAGLGLLIAPSFVRANDLEKGDNKDDARSGKIDVKGDGNSGQGDDVHKKKAPCDKCEKKETARAAHDCDKERCFDHADRAALEEIKKKIAAILDQKEAGERDLGGLEAAVKSFIEGKKICPELFKKLRCELGAEIKRRRAEAEANDDKTPDHRCRGEKCKLCGDFKRQFGEHATQLRERVQEITSRLREEAKERCREHAGEDERCGKCGAIRQALQERIEGLRAEFRERVARLREEFKGRCVREGLAAGGPGPLPPLGGREPRGNNGVGNGTDPQPPGNPPVNDGAGTRPGRPGLRR